MTMSLRRIGRQVAAVAMAAASLNGTVGGQTPTGPVARPADSTPPAPAGVAQATVADPNVPPPDYVIGADDILTVRYWRDDAMSADVVVRPDGKITLPLINEVHAAGLTPEQLRAAVVEAASKLVEGPTVSVIVKQINSRRIFITGEVAKPGPYPLSGRMNVLQLLTLAGGLTEYADKGSIAIFRTENGKQVRYRFNYNEFLDGKNLQQNIELKPNDTIVVKD
jgi:polysaccharide export outer membrane protein